MWDPHYVSFCYSKNQDILLTAKVKIRNHNEKDWFSFSNISGKFLIVIADYLANINELRPRIFTVKWGDVT